MSGVVAVTCMEGGQPSGIVGAALQQARRGELTYAEAKALIDYGPGHLGPRPEVGLSGNPGSDLPGETPRRRFVWEGGSDL